MQVRLTDLQKVALQLPAGLTGEATKIILTRQEVESMAKPLFRAARNPIDAACWQVQPIQFVVLYYD